MTGRSRRYASPGRDHRTHVRFTADEYAELADAAARAGLTTTGYVGEAALAGRVILYHRHVGPVLVRDWSVRMDLFTATVAASADTWKFRNAAARPNHTVKDVRELVDTEYLRPIPAQSDYLATATNPMPWPTRTGPRQPRGGRPMLGAEKRLTGSKRAAALTRTVAHPL